MPEIPEIIKQGKEIWNQISVLESRVFHTIDFCDLGQITVEIQVSYFINGSNILVLAKLWKDNRDSGDQKLETWFESQTYHTVGFVTWDRQLNYIETQFPVVLMVAYILHRDVLRIK